MLIENEKTHARRSLFSEKSLCNGVLSLTHDSNDRGITHLLAKCRLFCLRHDHRLGPLKISPTNYALVNLRQLFRRVQ